MSTNNRILVGLSGGVDSAVSAYLLQREGWDVVAGFMKNYTTEDDSCPTRRDRDDALRVAEHLGIRDFVIMDFRREYEARIIDYIYERYDRGLTPNPDVLCNNLVKFDLFAEEAIKLGCAGVATGHYARTDRDDTGMHLLRGVDENKDQSYFLSRLSGAQLQRAHFPVWHLKKPAVRDIARRIGLPNAERPDSQGLCFIGKVPIREFLRSRIPENPGDIVDTAGNTIGRHEGLAHYTVGQRRGIRVGGGPARFVVAKDRKNNRLIVGGEHAPELYDSICHVCNWHWIEPARAWEFEAGVKIRYRQPDQRATVRIHPEDHTGTVRFSQRQRAITPGQIIVAYHADRVVGSAEIVSAGDNTIC